MFSDPKKKKDRGVRGAMDKIDRGCEREDGNGKRKRRERKGGNGI